jgi:cell division protein FtsB
MPLARPATARNRSPVPPQPLEGVRRAAQRIRWDRVGRVGLLVTLGIVICLYIQPALSIYHAWRAEHQQATTVHQLLRSNAYLRGQVKSLNRTSTIVTEARALGMVRSGEKAYVVVGLPR